MTNCYNITNKNRELLHPYIGLMAIPEFNQKNNSVCVKTNYVKNLLMHCTSATSIDNNVLNSIKHPIKPEDYLFVYFGLENIDQIIMYINNNIDMSTNMKSRILDFTFMKYKDNIENDTIKWTELIRTIFNNRNLSDDIIIKILKKIIKKYDLDTHNYPFNLLLKIKKFLDYNI